MQTNCKQTIEEARKYFVSYTSSPTALAHLPAEVMDITVKVPAEDDGDDSNTLPRNAQGKPRHRGHEINSKTIKAPPFSYACLQLVSDAANPPELDELSVRSYTTAALTQFLGLTGSAISVDILKVSPRECWIRVPRDDLSPVMAAMGGWIGGTEAEGRVSWRVKMAGSWLGVLVAQADAEGVWND